MSTPPIPMRCAHRPTLGGLVIPWVSVEHSHGHVLGAVHNSRMVTCVIKGLCQICGQPLGRRVVVLCRERDFAAGYSSEAGMHPECAHYSAAACPMLNGRMTRHRRTPVDLSGKSCDKPGCDCAGWIGSDDVEHRIGKPAEDYLAVWLDGRHYRAAVDPKGNVLGVALRHVPVLRMRVVDAPYRQQEPAGMAADVQLVNDVARLFRNLPPAEREQTHG